MRRAAAAAVGRVGSRASNSNALIPMLNATTSSGAFAPPAARKLANAADAKQQRALAHINQGCPDVAVHSDQLRLAGWLE